MRRRKAKLCGNDVKMKSKFNSSDYLVSSSLELLE